jgi:quercetin dioxygenase-like cupin family protein/pyrroloquinoline quinone (PQQ) biosynthesis protein C
MDSVTTELNNENGSQSPISEAKLDIVSRLKQRMDTHPMWNSKLLKACELGHFTKDDFKILFEQYFIYSKNFTRYLCALMANMEDDFHRSQLSENIWEEGGGEDLSKRHSEIFRQFLIQGLDVKIDEIKFRDFSSQFMNKYLSYCMTKPGLEGSAFLSFGTEAIVPRLYNIFLKGMKKTDIETKHLHFFELHVECDDEHAETLEEIVLSFSNEANFEQRCFDGINAALDLREQFFNDLFSLIYESRVTDKVDKINAKKSLFVPGTPEHEIKFNPSMISQNFKDMVYFNKVESKGIEFSVNRAPFKSEVLDARIVKIASGKTNERHTHAHESIFYILEGEGKVIIDKIEVSVKKGDSVFVPRWCVHQTQNSGNDEMVILAITDFYLTGRALVGNYNSTARMKK